MEKTTVGRADGNTLVLAGESVSASQGEIPFNTPEVIVRDLGSRNGIFVDGIRLTGQTPIKPGHTVRFGSVEARLELDAVP